MRTAEIDYDLPASLPGDPKTTLSVNWEIEFQEAERHCLRIKARALTVQTIVGGMPFGETDVSGYCPDELRDWLQARATDITFESIGYTEAEAIRDYIEENEDREEESNQIGRPI